MDCLTSFSVNVLLGKLVPPHGVGDLSATLTEGLDLAREGVVDVNRHRGSCQSTNSLVEVSGNTRNKCNQVSQGQDQLLLDLLGYREQLGPLQEIHQSRRGTVEEAEGDHQSWRVFLAQLFG